ncbi:TPA: hypothetical protein QEM72_004376 [Pseudomonas putida]|uniref:hypothetical protein n=1 Tax=Pseudomonas putida TaxID=303 RepID=UPI00236332CD|nr:hypothetical protein [Pseudomonas putida]MDD2077113.1 hypothetical protein [Pseudomonas putida]HDS1693792.1 hypothetical protein [Pseudomonas putida]
MDRQIEGAQHRYDEALKEGENPAFPVAASEYGGHGTCFGLTIRDYFAAHAPCVPDDFDWASGETDLVQRMTRWRYAYADSMLAARVKP